MNEASRIEIVAVPCCCVLRHEPSGTEMPCKGYTTGPDDPFCDVCTTRHDKDPRVLVGETTVHQRIPQRQKEVAHE